jgi:hypothetical protein
LLQASRSWSRLAITFFALFAFVVQGGVTQTHIHFSSEVGGSIAAGHSASAAKTASVPLQDRQHPANDDPANCPLCQQILLSGAFITPSLAVLQLPSEVAFSILHLPAAIAVLQRQSHSWQGRAPPRL